MYIYMYIYIYMLSPHIKLQELDLISPGPAGPLPLPGQTDSGAS